LGIRIRWLFFSCNDITPCTDILGDSLHGREAFPRKISMQGLFFSAYGAAATAKAYAIKEKWCSPWVISLQKREAFPGCTIFHETNYPPKSSG
jgi:hypothetical protein